MIEIVVAAVGPEASVEGANRSEIQSLDLVYQGIAVNSKFSSSY